MNKGEKTGTIARKHKQLKFLMAKKAETEKKPAVSGITPTPVATETKSTGRVSLPLLLKNRWLLIGLGTIVIFIIGWLIYSTVIKKESSQDEELTYAEQLNNLQIVETADQETVNSVLLTQAWAFADEGDYESAIQKLESIKEPSVEIKIAVDDLYAQIYTATGQGDLAKEYGQAALQQQEKDLLANLEDAPDLHYSLARLYEAAGDTAKAKEHYQAYIDEFDAPPDELEDFTANALEISKQKVNTL